MKHILLIILSLSSITAWSECSSNIISIFPTNKHIAKNSIFLIEGHLASQKVIIGLNTHYPIYLESENEKISLTVQNIYKGQAGLTQALLVPATDLTLGMEYYLKIDSLPRYETLNRYNATLGKHEPISFLVDALPDTKPPILDLIAVKRSFNERYGCGNAAGVTFNISVNDSSEYLVKTTVTSLSTGEKTTYCLQAYQNTITIGFDMCSGAFVFKGNDYLAEFDIIDASGNISVWDQDPVAFQKPVKKPILELMQK